VIGERVDLPDSVFMTSRGSPICIFLHLSDGASLSYINNPSVSQPSFRAPTESPY